MSAKKLSYLPQRIAFYPDFHHFKLIIAFCHTKNYKQAEGIFKIANKFFNEKFTDKQREELIAIYDKMTVEQRKLRRRNIDEPEF